MMTTPPMVVAMGSGYFGLNLGKGLINGVFIGSLYPHIAYGIALGLLLERYTRHQGCFQIDQRRPTERDESDQLLSQVLRMKHQTMSRKFSAAQSEGLAVLADQELVGRAQAGDVCSFEMLVRRHGDRIYRLARRLCDGRTQDAEDSFQNALLKAFRHLAAFRGEAPFSSWLTRIMINECLMHWRQRSRERHWLRLDQRFEAEQKSMPHEVADSSQDLEEVYARREFQRILQQCLAGLPASYRVAFVLHEIDGLSTQETATRMGLSPSGAKSLWRRTRLRVQKFLRKKYCRDDECYWPGASNFPVPRKGQKGKETTCSPSS
jgi:RNA polymerase sigma-70 factor (ECF subfamily)